MTENRAALAKRLEEARAGVSVVASQQREVAGVLETPARLRTKLKAPDKETRRDLVRALVPGMGDHVVKLNKDGTIRLKVVLTDGGHSTTSGAAR
jgi:hypothetical protein